MNNMLKDTVLPNPDINLNKINYGVLYDFLKDFHSKINSPNFSAIGFDFDDYGLIRQIQPLDGYDFVQAFNLAYHNPDVYGDTFCLLHHDLNGFHYLIF